MKYFAYGSNISEKRMINERKIDFENRTFAYLENYKLVFNKVSQKNNNLGFANIVESEGSIVEGALYELNVKFIEKIDRYEGYPKHYYRKTIEVLCNDEKVKAITYMANPNMIKENIKPNKHYLNYILEGKDILTEKYYNNLRSTETFD